MKSTRCAYTRDIDKIVGSLPIRVNGADQVDQVRATFETIELTFVSSVNGGVAWVNRDDINRAYLTATRTDSGEQHPTLPF